MIATLIGIQTICISVASGYVINHFRPKFSKLKLKTNDNGFKIYKTN